MTLPILIAGIILRATSGWFSGQHTVGDICIWVGAVTLAIQIVIVIIGAVAVSSTSGRRRR